MPLESAEEAIYANLTFTVPISVERDFSGRNVVQVSAPVVSTSGAGFVGAGQMVLYQLVRLMQRRRPLVSAL